MSPSPYSPLKTVRTLLNGSIDGLRCNVLWNIGLYRASGGMRKKNESTFTYLRTRGRLKFFIAIHLSGSCPASLINQYYVRPPSRQKHLFFPPRWLLAGGSGKAGPDHTLSCPCPDRQKWDIRRGSFSEYL